MSSVPFSQTVVISFLIFLVPPLIQADEDDQLYFTGIFPIVFRCISSAYVDLGPHFKLWKSFPGFASSNNTKIYMETVDFVVISYVSLLLINWSNIWLAIFPLIAIGFILPLFHELNCQGNKSQQCDDSGEDVAGSSGGDQEQEGGRETKEAEAAALVPYWVLCGMRHYHSADNFAVSQFLLFFSSMLGALTLMMARLKLVRAASGVATAWVLLWKASLVVLLVTTHTVAADLLGENVMQFILPELAPVLLWLSVHLDRREGLFVTAERIRSHGNVIAVFGAASVACFAFLAASMDEFVLYWCIRAMVTCGVSGLLLYYAVFMLCHWPGPYSTATPFLEEAVELLKLWANTLLKAAAALLVFAVLAAVWLGLVEKMVAEPSNFFSYYVIRSSNR